MDPYCILQTRIVLSNLYWTLQLAVLRWSR